MSTPQPQSAPARTPEVRGSLLFVDDEPNILSALRRLFRPKGFTVHIAGSGREGLELLESQSIDVVISDMRMPEMDGAAFLGQVAERWPAVMRILLTGYSEMDSTVEAVNRGHIFSYFTKPWDDNELRLGVDNALRQKRLSEERLRLMAQVSRQNEQLKELNAGLEGQVRMRTAQLQTAMGNLRNINGDLKKSYLETVRAFSQLLELRDPSLAGHSRRTADNARRVAQELGLDEKGTQDLMFGGLLLQAGKLALPDKLLSRPLNALLKEEREEFLKHAAVGENLLRNIAQLKDAASLIGAQYEHFDGSGVPRGLTGEQIPLGARVLAVLRDYDLLQEGGLTGKRATVSDAQEVLRRQRGKRYDPDVVDAFLRTVGVARGADYRPVIEASPVDLAPGMEIVDVTYNNKLFLKDTVLTPENIKEIHDLQGEVGPVLRIRVRARK